VAVRSETIRVSGIRCERCVTRLGGALGGLDGLESANANLMGQLSLSWDDERLGRDTILAALARSGFRPVGAQGAALSADRRADVPVAPDDQRE
jgi:copper chaperone CopZ